MGLLTLIASFVLAYLVYNVASGLVLGICYFIKEGKIADTKEFSNLIFFPATGLGAWLYNRNERMNISQKFNKQWHIYKNMLRLNWLFILLIIGYEVYFFVHLYIMYKAYTDFKTDFANMMGKEVSEIVFYLFGWAIHYSLIFAFAGIAFFLLISFLFCAVVFILVPKIELNSIERSYNGNQLQE